MATYLLVFAGLLRSKLKIPTPTQLFLSLFFFINYCVTTNQIDTNNLIQLFFLISVILSFRQIKPIINDILDYQVKHINFLLSLFQLIFIVNFSLEIIIDLPKKYFFPFLEHSHFALAYAPFLFYAILTKTRLQALLLTALSFGYAYLLPNLTVMLVAMAGTSLFIFFRLELIFRLIIFNILIIILTIILLNIDNIIAYLQINNPYIYYRLTQQNVVQNTSLNVWIHAWYLAFLTLIQYPFGIGFEGLSIFQKLPVTGYEDLITVKGIQISRYDLGVLAPKIIVEYGVFGIFLIYLFINKSKSLIMLIKKGLYDKNSLLMFCYIIALFIELIFRTTGLWSLNVLFVMYGLFNKNFNKNTLY